MVKIIAESSPTSPTVISRDRYKYRYGYGYKDNDSQRAVGETTVYRRPVVKKKDMILDIDKTKNDNEGAMNYCIHIIANKFNILDTICDKIDTIVSKRPQIAEHCNNDLRDEVHETREINQKSSLHEKEKEKEKEKERERREMINKKLGKIVYHSRFGEKFVAEHSTQLHIYSDKYDKKIMTHKVVWNDRIFQTKKEWFSEMEKLVWEGNK